ncbi:MAG TPA: POTRA domain-containing protein [Oligoflexia bacterium]|nr:POTRA domain-containing protein [Oligoflexia bacterium]HMP47340.1 POTRA domain-containing protein [Oligoflexia bacterium]
MKVGSAFWYTGFICTYFLIFLYSSVLSASCPSDAPVKSIRFITDIGLGFKDLSSGIKLKKGLPCSDVLVSQSIEKLYERGIFEFIEASFEVEQGSDEITVNFLLIPYLVLSKTEFQGNFAIKDHELGRVIRLRPGDRIDESSIKGIEHEVRSLYRHSGFLDVEVEYRLIAETTSPLTRIRIVIKEGVPRKIERVEFAEGEDLTPKEILDSISEYATDKILSRDAVRDIRRYALRQFREKGFHKARVSIVLKFEEDASNVDLDVPNEKTILSVKLLPRNRLRFRFKGNSYYSRSQLLEVLRLDQRTAPLQRSSLNSLCRSIDERYREAGFASVSVDCSFSEEVDKKYGGVRDVFTVLIDEGPMYKVLPPIFKGNTIISDKKLSELVNMVPRSFFGSFFGAQRGPTEEMLSGDMLRIKEAYRARGLDRVEVRTRIIVDEDKLTTTARYRIKEGAGNAVKSVKVNLSSLKDDENLSSILNLWELNYSNGFYLESEVEERIGKLRDEIYKIGYPDARISGRYLQDEQRIDVEVISGPLVEVGRIILQGNFYTSDKIILRELKLKEGDPWNPSVVEESKHALLSLGIFRSVIIEPVGGNFNGGREDLIVKVQERETGTIQGLIEMSTQDGLHIQTQVGQRNLAGNARALVLGLDGYFRGVDSLVQAARARLGFGSPRIFGTDLDYGLESFYQTALELNDSFKLDRYGFSNSFRYPFLKSLRLTASQTTYSERLFDVATPMILGDRDRGTTFYSAFRFLAEYDRRDDVFNPTRGYRLESGIGYFPETFGSEVRMFEGHAQGTSLMPLGSGITYALNLRGAFREVLNSGDTVPLGSRYFIGGRDTLRGYTRFQVGPRASGDGLVVGGDTFAVFSQEVRYQFTSSTQGIFFLDTGQAFLRHADRFDGDRKNNLLDLRFSPGFGMQYLTPIGPLSAEVGFATDREFGERWGRFIVGIGSAF